MLHQSKLKRYGDLISKCDRFKRKGKAVLHTSVNGHMFSLFNTNNEIGIRFSKEVQEKYMHEFNTGLYYSHNIVMGGYVRIPDDVLIDTSRVMELLNESYDYVMSLPGK